VPAPAGPRPLGPGAPASIPTGPHVRAAGSAATGRNGSAAGGSLGPAPADAGRWATQPRPGSGAAGSPAQTEPHPAEAAALAGAFAVDYLSWDQDDPDRRGRVLTDYLAVPGADPARLGWSGQGRQRAEFALPGLVRPDGDGRVLVDVRVRVTPYRSVGDHAPDPAAEPEPDVAGVPAVAPAPTGRGWRSLASSWIRISVPVALESGRLVVDAWEETLGEDGPPAPPRDRDSDDHVLDADDPLAEPGAVPPDPTGATR
jgi:hypothetical protein